MANEKQGIPITRRKTEFGTVDEWTPQNQAAKEIGRQIERESRKTENPSQ